MSATAETNKVRVMVGRLLGGAVVGAAGTGLFLVFVGEPHMNLKDPSVMLAIVAGVSYVLIGLLVAVGLVAPSAGARFLNVEDAEEIREERPKLGSSALSCVLTGCFLLVLALSGGGVIAAGAALAIAVLCLGGMIVLGWISMKRYDELTRQMGQEASAWAFYATLLLFGGWAALAQLGFTAWVDPLGFVASLAMLQLVAIFVAVARRGLMMPR